MRKAIIILSQLDSALLVLVAVISLDEGRRFANIFFVHSAWASDDAEPGKAVMPEKSPCSAADVIATVKSLSGENSDNPAAALLAKMANATFSLDAIRTVTSSPNQSICEARLTIKTDVPVLMFGRSLKPGDIIDDDGKPVPLPKDWRPTS